MKLSLSTLLITLLGTSILCAGERVNIAEDDASHSAYKDGWDSGKNGGMGFGSWMMQSRTEGDTQTHAGFFIGQTADQPALNFAAKNDKAFGMFANGTGFETACAFRSFNKPLAVGDSFSILMETGEFTQKFGEGDSSKPGSVGFTLRAGTGSGSPDDYDHGARFQFCVEKEKGTYQVHDGEPDSDTGLTFSDGGVSVTVTLVTADTYDLEIATLDTKQTKKLPGRKLGGTAGAAIESFVIFDRNSETNDAFFNAMQVSRAQDASQR
jgi:hypothetical protein